MTNDPFQDPTPRAAQHASADSFRGRLILIEPVKVERDVPKMASQPNGAKGDRVTATVTVVDGQGPVQIYAKTVPTGQFLDGPTYRGVWFNQDQIAAGLQTPDGRDLLKMVLCRIDTLKPGTRAEQGNPWVINAVSEQDKDTARQFLARQMVGSAQAPTQPPAPAQAQAPQGYGYPQPVPAPPANGYGNPAPALANPFA